MSYELSMGLDVLRIADSRESLKSLYRGYKADVA